MTRLGNHGEALATIRNWDDLPAAFRAAVQSLNVSHEVLDTVSGLQPGYVSKLLAPVPVKGFGKMAFDLLLGATGKMLVMVDDPAALERVQTRLTKRDETRMPKFKNLSMHSTVVHFKISLRKMKRNGRSGGKNSRKFITTREAKKIARKAAWMRWEKPKLMKMAKGEVSAEGYAFCRWSPAIARAMRRGTEMGLPLHLHTKSALSDATRQQPSQPQ